MAVRTTVTFSMEGDGHSMVECLESWLSVLKSASVDAQHNQAASDIVHWDETAMAQLWGEIQPAGRALLKELATSPDGYSSDTLREKIGSDEYAKLCGRLSTVGSALRRLKYPSFLERDNYRKVWRMNREVASLILLMPSPVGDRGRRQEDGDA